MIDGTFYSRSAAILRTNSTRSVTLNRQNTWCKCVRTVLWDRPKSTAICLSRLPCRISSTIAAWRGGGPRRRDMPRHSARSIRGGIADECLKAGGFRGRPMRPLEQKKSVEPRTLKQGPPRPTKNVPWPTPLAGRGSRHCLFVRTWRFCSKQRLDARASIQIVTGQRSLTGESIITCQRTDRNVL